MLEELNRKLLEHESKQLDSMYKLFYELTDISVENFSSSLLEREKVF